MYGLKGKTLLRNQMNQENSIADILQIWDFVEVSKNLQYMTLKIQPYLEDFQKFIWFDLVGEIFLNIV